jgi:hypothetical protein
VNIGHELFVDDLNTAEKKKVLEASPNLRIQAVLGF